MQLPGELDERCRAGAPGKQAFGGGSQVHVMNRVSLGEYPPVLELVPDLASRRGFVSGAPAVVSAGRAALRAAGAKRVQTDYFIGY